MVGRVTQSRCVGSPGAKTRAELAVKATVQPILRRRQPGRRYYSIADSAALAEEVGLKKDNLCLDNTLLLCYNLII